MVTPRGITRADERTLSAAEVAARVGAEAERFPRALARALATILAFSTEGARRDVYNAAEALSVRFDPRSGVTHVAYATCHWAWNAQRRLRLMNHSLSSLAVATIVLSTACACTQKPSANVVPSRPSAAPVVSAPLRGTIVEVGSRSRGRRYRLDYYDVSEPDSSYKELSARGLQGGGPTWAGIVTGLLELRSPETLERVALDDEAEGLAVWSDDRAALETIARLIGAAKKDPALLNAAIERAKGEGKIE